MTSADDLSSSVSTILSQSWNIRDGTVVPSSDDVALAGGGVRLEATVLYADLAQSSRLATDFKQRTAAKITQSFLYCTCRLISTCGGTITSFDGDRAMGIFLSPTKNTSAAKCALHINYAMLNIIRPKVEKHFSSFRETGFAISHCVGVDTSSILAVRAGQRGSNDLIWIGRAPNLAAKLSDIRDDPYHSYITADVYSQLMDSSKYGSDRRLMWEERLFEYIGEKMTVYRSNWHWKP